MILPVICDFGCDSHLRLSCDTEKKRFVAVCVECGAEYELLAVDLSDDMVSNIQMKFAISGVGKTLSYMAKRA